MASSRTRHNRFSTHVPRRRNQNGGIKSHPDDGSYEMYHEALHPLQRDRTI
jgi:hypothetical protein